MKKEEYLVLAIALEAQFEQCIRMAMSLETMPTEKKEFENILAQGFQNTKILTDKLKSMDVSEEDRIADAKARAKALAKGRADALEAENPYLPPMSDDEDEEDDDLWDSDEDEEDHD